MTGGAGIASAFDGVTDQGALSGAVSPSQQVGYVDANAVGKDWGAGVAKLIGGVVLYGPNNQQYVHLTDDVAFKVQGSADGAGWTDIFTGTLANGVSAVTSALSGFVVSTPYRYHRAVINGPGGLYNTCVSEAEFYEVTALSVDVPAASVVVVGKEPTTNPATIPAAQVAVQGHAPASLVAAPVPVGAVSVSAHAPAVGVFAAIPVAAVGVGGWAPSAYWDVPLSEVPTAQAIYLVKITGAADSLPDVLVPAKSVLMRLKYGEQSYLSVVFPFTESALDAISDRPNGSLVVLMGFRLADGRELVEPIGSGLVSSFRYDLGGQSGSITVIAYGDNTTGASKSRAVGGVSYRSGGSGKRALRAPVDLFLRPGDEVVDGADRWQVGEIVYNISTDDASMDVQEAG